MISTKRPTRTREVLPSVYQGLIVGEPRLRFGQFLPGRARGDDIRHRDVIELAK
jgi:hypothetical protein